ncbi:methylenetetrahydrofolate reductase [NAD(P)H] [Deferribacter autotrophicus]|uniref:Methylenetetrahydrofolate reductase n=1 Tax=Deferribacter autotrophicus TaxID=500465 RepID=A0A5A8F316_9BACT|nr:methylenetetrahydrofolate reductase [NAD(P)H] [Deferribacter autotrophicus]KAA0257331.1 methylenetetrahydrofolate reductase [NAD(P)H] [Deferribacter autotrophicus]
MKISEILESKKMTLSFEFFPPKKVENEKILFDTIDILKNYNPDFVSVTYGAGGSTKDKTVDWTIRILKDYNLNVMMHLTCIASSKSDIDVILEILKAEGVENILALRGDIPKDFPVEDIKKDFNYAYELVKYIREKNGFSIGVAGYPEGHLESESLEKDIEYLKLKVDSGADFVITQLFFDNNYYFEFLNRAVQVGIDVPIIPGIMPVVNLSQVQRFVEMCGATVPDELVKKLEGRTPDDMYKIGVEYAVLQCKELIENNVRGLHFYTLNKYNATKEILEGLGYAAE